MHSFQPCTNQGPSPPGSMVSVCGGQCCYCTRSFSWAGAGRCTVGHGSGAIFLEEGAAEHAERTVQILFPAGSWS